MAGATKKRILFSGYAPVHFVCFLPVYTRLRHDPHLEIYLSGGFRDVSEEVTSYRLDGFYDPFPVDRERILSVEESLEAPFDVLVCAHLGDTLIPPAARHTVQIFHGVSFRNLAVKDKALRWDTLCLPGRYHAERYREYGLIEPGGPRYLLTGFPKTDALVAPGDAKAALASLGLSRERPTLLLAPAGDRHNALEVMGRELLAAIDAAGKWNVMVKPHDHPKKKIDWFAELADMENDRLRLVRDTDVVPYLRAADLLITDVSSVAVEYTLLDRPILFVEVPKLWERTRKRAPALDLESYGRTIGTVVERPDELPEAITGALAGQKAQSALRRQMAAHLFFAPGAATEHVAGVILEAAGVRDALPPGVEVVSPGA